MRVVMLALGALAGFAVWGLVELWEAALVPERAALALSVFAAAFFAGLLAMAGPLAPPRAAAGAAGIAAATAALMVWASLRFDAVAGLFDTPFPAAAGLAVAGMPVPFWIAAAGAGWRHYPTLFAESWSLVIRVGTAAVFTLIVWAVIGLSDALFGLVGLTVIEDLIDLPGVPYVVTGAVFGLALAVMLDLGDFLAPDLVIRLLRLLLPVVLAVLVVFLAALPLRGLSRLFGGISAGATLLAMAAAAVGLVTLAVERSEAEAVRGRLMAGAARLLAALAVVPAALGAWAVGLRVADAGWSPARLAAAVAAAIAVLWGLCFLAAVVSGRDWRGRVRQANVAMALAMLAAAALWLTPVLNAEAIAARDQVARYADGRTPVERVDLAALVRWGRPGAAAIAELQRLADGGGHAALAARLADRPSWDTAAPAAEPGAARAALRAALPVNPPAESAARDAVVAALGDWEVADWLRGCAPQGPDGRPACALVFADLLPVQPGTEALAVFVSPEGWLRHEALIRRSGGGWERSGGMAIGGGPLAPDAAAAVLRHLQEAPVATLPPPIRMLDIGQGAGRGLMVLP
jgi:hypothetical protein